MDNYNYHKGMNGIIQELKCLLKTKNIGIDSDQALLLDFQATLETKPEKAIKLEKDALHINDSIPKIANYAMFLTEQQEPERGISELQKLSGIIKEYHSDD